MSSTLDQLFALFLRERKYLRNVRPQTIEWYETAWHAFKKSATACPTCPADLKQGYQEEFVYALRDRGVRPVTGVEGGEARLLNDPDVLGASSRRGHSPPRSD